MRIWGATFLIVGVGSFVLPMLGYQFIVVRLFGRHGWIAALALVTIGIALLVTAAVRTRTQKSAPPK